MLANGKEPVAILSNHLTSPCNASLSAEAHRYDNPYHCPPWITKPHHSTRTSPKHHPRRASDPEPPPLALNPQPARPQPTRYLHHRYERLPKTSSATRRDRTCRPYRNTITMGDKAPIAAAAGERPAHVTPTDWAGYQKQRQQLRESLNVREKLRNQLVSTETRRFPGPWRARACQFIQPLTSKLNDPGASRSQYCQPRKHVSRVDAIW